MKKYCCIILLLCIALQAPAQDIIINGKKGNRLLTWDDFKGEPENNSAHAYTAWDINYGLKNITLQGDTVKIGSFAVTLSFDENRSWIKPQKQTDRLLKHEQGHFDLGLICQREIINALNNTVFFKNTFQEKIQTVISSILEKYQSLGRQYDRETEHSMNQPSQDTWNTFFAKELNR